MNRTVQVLLPGGRQRAIEFPDSQLMAGVVESIFGKNEYPPIGFLQPSATTIVDIGANIGCTAVLFAAQYPNATIWALEPAAEAFALLQKNTQGMPQVKAFHVGAYNKDVAAELFMGAGASVTNSLVANSMTGGQREKVELRRISSFLDQNGISRISLLKIDTEGSEMAILEDLAPRLATIDSLFVEYHSEEDRLAIDKMLTPRYLLFHAHAEHPHRGTGCYVSKFLLGTMTQWNTVAIGHPTF